MSIWPWRSRPVITPFSDDYSGRIIIYDGPFTTQSFSLSLSDNLYIIPTSISIVCVCAAGIRNTTDSELHFSRGSNIFAASHFGRLTSNRTLHFFLSTYGSYPSASAPDPLRPYILPYPIFLYPNDVLTFTINSFLAADAYGPIIIHGKFWEVH